MRPPRFSSSALGALSGYSWPGNVRELFNVVERLSILAPGPEVQPADVSAVLPREAVRAGAPVGTYEATDGRGLRELLDDYERSLITGALEAAAGNVAEAGRKLQTDRANLYRRMKRLGVRS